MSVPQHQSSKSAVIKKSIRRKYAVNFVKQKGKITNKEYQELNETSDRTALRDLEKLTELGVFLKDGEKKGTFYKLKPGG